MIINDTRMRTAADKHSNVGSGITLFRALVVNGNHDLSDAENTQAVPAAIALPLSADSQSRQLWHSDCEALPQHEQIKTDSGFSLSFKGTKLLAIEAWPLTHTLAGTPRHGASDSADGPRDDGATTSQQSPDLCQHRRAACQPLSRSASSQDRRSSR